MTAEWTVRCQDGTWSATAEDGDHAARIADLFDAPDFGGHCGPHAVHHSDPSKALTVEAAPPGARMRRET